MKRLPLPHSDLAVSELCFGVSSFDGRATEAEYDALLTQYLDAGGNFLDTAHCYNFWDGSGAGSSERKLGAALKRLGCRDRVIVATKGGHPAGDGYPRPDRYMDPALLESDLTESLDRLGLDHVDLYYLHRDDPRVPVAEVIGHLNGEIRRGRVRAFGASNWRTARLREAAEHSAGHGLRGFAASQVQWSLPVPNWEMTDDPTTRCVSDADAAFYAAEGPPVVAYSATASGYLEGNPRADGLYDNPTSRRRRDRARDLAAQRGVTPGQVGIAWLRHQATTTIPLFGTANPAHLAELLAAASLALTPEQARSLAAP